jgi:hypothetical protein
VSTQYPVNFTLGYIDPTHITARVGNEVDGLGNPVYRAITFLGPNLFQIAGTPAGIGVPIVFERTVPKESLIVNFSNGDVLDEMNLDISQLQTIMAVQEVLDGRFASLGRDLDFANFTGINARTPTASTDLANKQYVDDRTGDLVTQVPTILAASAAATAAATSAAASAAISVAAAESVNDITDYIKRYGVTPFDFGALGQGADETAQLNAAIDAVITGGGGTVWLPAPPSGAWRFNGRIQMFKPGDQTSYLRVSGVGAKARIEIAATTGDIFDFGSTSETFYADLEHLHVVHLNARTSGIALRYRNNAKGSVWKCVFDGLYSGIDTNRVNDLTFEDVDLNFPNATNGRAINHQANVAPTATRSDVIVYKNVNVQCNNGGTDGMFIEGPVYGVTTNGLYMLGANNGLYINSPSNDPNEFPQYCRFNVFETDRAKDRSLYMIKARYFDFDQCLFSNTSGATGDLYPQGNADNEAVRIESNVQDVNFDQTRIGFCRKQAAVIGGQKIRMLGCTFEDAAKDTPTDYALVYMPATARVVHFRDCFGDGANRARFAVQYESAVTGKCVDFAWKGMKAGGAFSAGAAANFVPAGQYQY